MKWCLPYAEDAISAALCAVFIHPKNNNSYITVLVVDFKTMSSIKVIGKHSGLEYNTLQLDIETFSVQIGSHISCMLELNTGKGSTSKVKLAWLHFRGRFWSSFEERRNNKYPDWKHHRLAWFKHGPGLEGSTDPKDPNLAKDTEASTAIY